MFLQSCDKSLKPLPLMAGAVIDWLFMETFFADRVQNAVLAVRHMTEENQQKEPKQWFLSELERVKGECENLALPSSLIQTKRVIEGFDSFKESGQLIPQIQMIEGRMRDELSAVRFVHITLERVKFLDGPADFGAAVFDAYPEARVEISEAGYCMAVGLPTACVMHLMRALESPLASICAELRVDFAGSWGEVLGAINRAIKEIDRSPNSSKPHDWDSRRKFYKETEAQFEHIKDAWRNYAMHGRDSYSEGQAKVIWEHLKHLTQAWALRSCATQSLPSPPSPAK